jgi:flagellar P-ring protein FlgI
MKANFSKRHLIVAIVLAALATMPRTAVAQIRLSSICRVKGQEERVLQGQGIVVGLVGTGDGNLLSTRRSISTLLEKMGNPLGPDGLKELKDFKNVALVVVTATIPAAGARQGDKIDCVVSSLGSAKSLKGGRLLQTALTGPGRAPSLPVYAFAQGSIELENPTIETTGRVFAGARLEEDFFNPYVRNNKVTLVLNQDQSSFEVAQTVAERINEWFGKEMVADPSRRGEIAPAMPNGIARAIDQSNIEIDIPPHNRPNPAMFVADVLRLDIHEPETAAQVTINQRTGSIVITSDVEIGAVVITHKNWVIEAGTTPTAQFEKLDPGATQTAKLEALLSALKAVHAPTEDVIDIIKGLAKSKKLHAKLVIE